MKRSFESGSQKRKKKQVLDAQINALPKVDRFFKKTLSGDQQNSPQIKDDTRDDQRNLPEVKDVAIEVILDHTADNNVVEDVTNKSHEIQPIPSSFHSSEAQVNSHPRSNDLGFWGQK